MKLFLKTDFPRNPNRLGCKYSLCHAIRFVFALHRSRYVIFFKRC